MGTRQNIFDAIERSALAMGNKANVPSEVAYPKGLQSGQAEEELQFAKKLQQLYNEHPKYYEDHLADIAVQVRSGLDNIRSKYLQDFKGLLPQQQAMTGQITAKEILPIDDWRNGEPQFNFKKIPQSGGVIEQLLMGIK